jgi:hypothetical protein
MYPEIARHVAATAGPASFPQTRFPPHIESISSTHRQLPPARANRPLVTEGSNHSRYVYYEFREPATIHVHNEIVPPGTTNRAVES